MSDVRIEGNYPVDKISDISMNIRVNEHGTLTYSGLVSNEEAMRYVEQHSDKELVKVYIKDKLEFCGYPTEISTEWPNADFDNNHCHFSVKLITSSVFSDTYLKKRFYQDTTRTFEEIITEALDDSQMGNLVALRGKEPIREPILQYRETDWQFALRMASRLGTLIIPNVISEESEFTLGIPKREAVAESNDFTYQMGRNISEFRTKFNETSKPSQLLKGFKEVSDFHNFIRYNMRSENRYNLGDSVIVDGKMLVVVSKTLAYKKSEIEEIYTLGHEQDFSVQFHNNKHIAGLELSGAVLERDGQRIKMLLDIDNEREEHGKTWFFYSPATNNAMYTMPLEDESVILQWQSEVDHDVLIVRPIRQNGGSMSPHDKRQLSTEHDSRMMIIPDLMMYENPVGSIKWLKGWGFKISTANNFFLMAEDIIIKSDAQILVKSPERISIGKTNEPSSIDMLNNDIHIVSSDVVVKSGVNDYMNALLPRLGQGFGISGNTASRLSGSVAFVNDARPVNIPSNNNNPLANISLARAGGLHGTQAVVLNANNVATIGTINILGSQPATSGGSSVNLSPSADIVILRSYTFGAGRSWSDDHESNITNVPPELRGDDYRGFIIDECGETGISSLLDMYEHGYRFADEELVLGERTRLERFLGTGLRFHRRKYYHRYLANVQVWSRTITSNRDPATGFAIWTHGDDHYDDWYAYRDGDQIISRHPLELFEALGAINVESHEDTFYLEKYDISINKVKIDGFTLPHVYVSEVGEKLKFEFYRRWVVLREPMIGNLHNIDFSKNLHDRWAIFDLVHPEGVDPLQPSIPASPIGTGVFTPNLTSPVGETTLHTNTALQIRMDFPQRIIIHHTVGSSMPSQRPYHFVVDLNGIVHYGRDTAYQGNGTWNNNFRSIHIAVLGNWDDRACRDTNIEPTNGATGLMGATQREALINIIADVLASFPTIPLINQFTLPAAHMVRFAQGDRNNPSLVPESYHRHQNFGIKGHDDGTGEASRCPGVRLYNWLRDEWVSEAISRSGRQA